MEALEKKVVSEQQEENASIFSNLAELSLPPEIVSFRHWMQGIQRQRPATEQSFRVAVYIRYYNQTRHHDYLEYHKKQYLQTLSSCPNWVFQGFYVDEGQSPPHMESAHGWAKLLEDCAEGNVDLIITQKMSNVSKKPLELAFCARLLASLNPKVGIYFISEDVYTLASYYLEDLQDFYFLESGPTKEQLQGDWDDE